MIPRRLHQHKRMWRPDGVLRLRFATLRTSENRAPSLGTHFKTVRPERSGALAKRSRRTPCRNASIGAASSGAQPLPQLPESELEELGVFGQSGLVQGIAFVSRPAPPLGGGHAYALPFASQGHRLGHGGSGPCNPRPAPDNARLRRRPGACASAARNEANTSLSSSVSAGRWHSARRSSRPNARHVFSDSRIPATSSFILTWNGTRSRVG